MKPSDQLFRLIKSLDKTEKGYFKKFATGYGRNQNYLLLFDAIDEQEAYDESALLRKFRNQAFAKQLSVAKNYLFELILRSQRQYRADSSKFMQLNALLENGEILFEKGLYEEALKAWEKARQLAADYDEMPFMLDIETSKRRYYIDMTAGDWQKYTDPSYDSSFELIDTYTRMLQIQRKYVTIINFIKTQPFFRTEEQRAEWDAFMQDPILAADQEPSDFYGKLYYHYIYNIYHLLCRNKEHALLSMKKIVDLWDAHPALKEIEPVRYLSAVNNYLTNLMYLQEYRQFVEYFDALQLPALNSVAKEAIYFEHLWLMRSTYFQIIGEIDRMLEWVDSTVKDLQKYASLMNKNRLLIIRFSMAHLETIKGNYEASNDLLQLIFDSKEVQLRKDIQAVSRILYTINHFQLDNFLLFSHVMTTSKHYLKSQDYYYEIERVFIRYMTRLMKEPGQSERKALFREMQDALGTLFQQEESERMAFESIRIMDWLESGIHGTPFIEVLRQKGPIY